MISQRAEDRAEEGSTETKVTTKEVGRKMNALLKNGCDKCVRNRIK